jgi:4-oxalocrotonate tautomerase
MPSIHVEMFAGRSVEQKRALAKALTEATVAVLGVPAQAVEVVFNDVQRHDRATGGELWCDKPAAATPGR